MKPPKQGGAGFIGTDLVRIAALKRVVPEYEPALRAPLAHTATPESR